MRLANRNKFICEIVFNCWIFNSNDPSPVTAKILDFGSGIEPTIIQMDRDHLLKKYINMTYNGYDLYDDYEIARLNNINKNTSSYF